MDADIPPEAGGSAQNPIRPASHVQDAEGEPISMPDGGDARPLVSSLSAMSHLEALSEAAQLVASQELENITTARRVIETALMRADADLRELQAALEAGGKDISAARGRRSDERVMAQARRPLLASQPGLGLTLHDAGVLHRAKRRLNTWDIISPRLVGKDKRRDTGTREDGVDAETQFEADAETEAMEVEVEDPWAEADEAVDAMPELNDPWAEMENARAGPSQPPESHADSAQKSEELSNEEIGEASEELDLSFPAFLAQPTIISALRLASSGSIHTLRLLCERHADEIWPYRFILLEMLPPWALPGNIEREGLLPAVGHTGLEKPWKWETPATPIFASIPETLSESPFDLAPPEHELLTAAQMSSWYQTHIASLDQSGQIDNQLAWVQHAASLSVPGLDALGEDLSLLSRLVYDAGLSPSQLAYWNIATWANATPSDVVAAYLSNSTADGVVSDVRRLVLPYLYVLEARAERVGLPDLELVDRLLQDMILGLPLQLALPVFEASKATLGKVERIVKDDVTVARLALACLYGSDQRDVWATMSAIFECLPVWELSGNPEDDAELTSTTLDSIAAFVRPTVSQPRPPKAKDLYLFFQPLPFASLSRALDILDVHLESGEALARWDVPVQLRFLLQSARDAGEQAELAEKMVRRAAAGSSGLTGKPAASGSIRSGLAEETRWVRLWDDMVKLNGGEDALLRGAFGMIGAEEMMRIYLGGLLRSGKFDIAKRMVSRLENSHDLKTELLEDIVLTISKELYENAENGNIHTGEMKLAYDCLTVAPSSAASTRERHFIEATSRLTTFSLPSPRTHSPITPVEIRHTKNKLDLVALLLTHSKDAYKHDELVFELVDKLGYEGDVIAKGEVLGMLSSAAIEGGEWEMASGWVEDAVGLARKNQNSGRREGPRPRSFSQADETAGGAATPTEKLRHVAWRSALALGRQSDYSDIPRRLTLLGYAIELAPTASLPETISEWRKVEEGQLKLSAAAKRRRLAGIGGIKGGGSNPASPRTSLEGSRPVSGALDVGGRFETLGADGEKRVLGSRTAARAAKMALDFGERWRSGGTPLLRASPGLGSSPWGASSQHEGSKSALARGSISGPSSRVAAPSGTGSGTGSGRSTPLFGFRQKGRRDSTTSRTSEEGRPSVDEERAGLVGLGIDDAERVRRGARRALVKGVGWLLGAEEGEM